jgi:hypothetical protein
MIVKAVPRRASASLWNGELDFLEFHDFQHIEKLMDHTQECETRSL